MSARVTTPPTGSSERARAASRRPGACAALPLAFTLLTGCPPSGPAVDPNVANAGSGVPTSGKITKNKPPEATPAPTPAPAVGAFGRETLIELYRADLSPDEGKRRAAQTKHGLRDASGNEVPARIAAYEAALKAFALERPDEWSALAQEAAADPGASAPPGR